MSKSVTIVDYEAGNLTSVMLALRKLGRDSVITGDPDAVRAADCVIFPGVGYAPHVMAQLQTSGLGDALCDYAATGRPLLGICIAAQVILDHSDEGDVPCLGLIAGRARALEVPPDASLPHMGWNPVVPVSDHPVVAGLPDDAQFYFVHSYYPSPDDAGCVQARTDYHGDFASVIGRDNIIATQFHPERSGRIGLKLIADFLAWRP
jgi:imidazole glycerol-phosphate synthase subunit HisH